MKTSPLRLTPLLLSVSLVTAAATDWPQWRGVNRDGISPESGLLKEWPADGPPLAWTLKGLGSGMGSVAIHGERVFVLGKRGKDGAFIGAFDLATQKEAWSARVSESGGDPNGTPTVDGGQVFAVSKDGKLLCCAEADGKELWRKDFAADFGGKMMSGWGFSESPLVDGDKVIVIPGADDAFMVALDRKTSAVLWKSAAPAATGRGKDGAGYTGAVISNAGGIRQYITLAGRGVTSVSAADGKLLWHYNRVANGTANIPTPLAWDDYVFCSSGYGTGAALLKIVKAESGPSPLEAQEQYFLNASTFQNHHGGMVRIGDYIYAGTGHNNGFPICLEWKTGKVTWNEPRGPGKESAAVIAADGNLYFRYQDGTMALIGATPEGYQLHGSFSFKAIGASWPHPAIHDGRLFLRNQDSLLCYDVRQKP